MPSSTSNFERTIPVQNWKQSLVATLLCVAALSLAWELYARAQGYPAALNDTADLWADRREAVQPDSLVLVGASRTLFDVDLDTFEKELGQRPIQLALVGTCAYPILEDLAMDESFRGTVICGIVPGIWFVPEGAPLANANAALSRRETRSNSDRIGHHIAMALEKRIAFLNNEDLNLERLLASLPIPNREDAYVMPPLPPYIGWIDDERQTRMLEACAAEGPLQETTSQRWMALFTPPRPPRFVPPEAAMEMVMGAMKQRLTDTVQAVEKIRSRGGQVIFVRYPSDDPLRAHETKFSPREKTWDPIIALSGAPGIHFEDHPELSSFQCPELSHLSAEDAVLFSQRLAPLIKARLD